MNELQLGVAQQLGANKRALIKPFARHFHVCKNVRDVVNLHLAITDGQLSL